MNFGKLFRIRPEKGDMRLLLIACMDFGCLRNQAAYLMATFEHETNSTYKPVEEAYWLSDAWRRKNLRYYPWHGRGHVQMTWKTNYAKAQNRLGIPFTKDPTLAMKSENSAKFSVVGTMEGWWTGKKISDYITLTKSDFKGARRVVNGTDKAQAIAKKARLWDAQLLEAGYGVTEKKEVLPTGEPVVVTSVDSTTKNVEGGKVREFLLEAGWDIIVGLVSIVFNRKKDKG